VVAKIGIKTSIKMWLLKIGASRTEFGAQAIDGDVLNGVSEDYGDAMGCRSS